MEPRTQTPGRPSRNNELLPLPPYSGGEGWGEGGLNPFRGMALVRGASTSSPLAPLPLSTGGKGKRASLVSAIQRGLLAAAVWLMSLLVCGCVGLDSFIAPSDAPPTGKVC